MAAKNQEMSGNFAEDDVSRKRIRKEQGVSYIFVNKWLESRDKWSSWDGKAVDHIDKVRRS